LATSYVLRCAVERIGELFGGYDLVFCGRQAIDGDTAQVGPQVAEKLGLPQITYAESIESLKPDEIVVRRALPLGTETVECTLPCLLTVVSSANQARPPSARRMMAHRLAAIPHEYRSLLQKWPEFGTEDELERYLAGHDQKITVWSAADVGVDYDRVGLSGSPTKVLKADYVVLESSGSKEFEANSESLAELMQELVQDYIV
jgi:electron transfer flavoprotein beta subunit